MAGGQSRWILAYALVPGLAVLIPWATGFWRYALWDYGVPLPWKSGGCPACYPLCLLACMSVSYDWGFFILDAAFYAAIGYAILFGLRTRRKTLNQDPPPRAQ